jgi:hypothetical protein
MPVSQGTIPTGPSSIPQITIVTWPRSSAIVSSIRLVDVGSSAVYGAGQARFQHDSGVCGV